MALLLSCLHGFVLAISLMSTLHDLEHMRIIGHALRITGTCLGKYERNFENLRIPFYRGEMRIIIYLTLFERLITNLCHDSEQIRIHVE